MSRTRLPLAGGVAGPVLFVAVFLAAGAVRPGYDPLRHPVSSLSIGPQGWVQMASFLVTGLLLLAFAVGLRAAGGSGWWVPVLIGLVAVGLMGAGVFTADPIGGYPPGTPPVPPRTADGVLHDLFSTPVFTALPAACLVTAVRAARRGRSAWAVWSAVTAVVFLTAFVLAGVGFAQNPPFAAAGGLFQRVALVVGMAWIAALAVRELRTAS